MFGGTGADGKVAPGGPYLVSDTLRNAVSGKGTAVQLAEVKTALKALGEGGLGGGTMRVITLDKGSAATLAEALGRVLPQIRPNPVNVVAPGSEPAPRPAEPEKGTNKS